MAQKARIEEYADGNVTIYNLRNNMGVPVFGLNEMISASRVTQYWDGTPMDESKVDNQLYLQLKALPDDSNPELGKYIGDYFKVNLPNEGELFLEKNTMAEMRSLSPVEILLIQMGFYRGVKLNGYYQEGDTPVPINYVISTTTEEDDGGSVITVHNVKLEHNFEGYLDVRYFGVFLHLDDVTDEFTRISNYVSSGYVINVPYGTYIGDVSLVDKAVKINFNYSTFTPISDQVGAIRLGGSRGEIYNVTGTVRYGETTINLSGSHNLVIGDIVMLEDKSVRPSDGLANMNKELLKILDIQGSEVLVEDMVRGDFVVGQVTLQKINVVNDVIVEDLIIQDSETNTFPCLWITDVENIVINNYKCYGFFGNALRVDRCYAGRTNNTYFIKPRSTLSGQGYGLAINDSRNIKSETTHGSGTRHVVDYKCSYRCTVDGVHEDDAKSSAVIMSHNGFGGFIEVSNVKTTGESYSVSFGVQGMSPENILAQTQRGYKVRNVEHIWKGVSATSFNAAVFFDIAYYSDLDIRNVTANYSSDTDLTDIYGASGGNVVRVSGNKRGKIGISNINSDVVAIMVRIDVISASGVISRYPTVISDVNCYRCYNMILLRGEGGVYIDGLTSWNVEDSVIRLDILFNQAPTYISLSNKGLDRSLSSGNVLLFNSSTSLPEPIRGSAPMVMGTYSSNLNLSNGGRIPIDKIYSSNSYLRIGLSSDIILDSSTPLEVPLVDGYRFRLAVGSTGDYSYTYKLTIPGGSDTVSNLEDVELEYGNIYEFMFILGKWRVFDKVVEDVL